MLLDDKDLLPDELFLLLLSSLSTSAASCSRSTAIVVDADCTALLSLIAWRTPFAVDELVLVLVTTAEVDAIVDVVLLEPAFEW